MRPLTVAVCLLAKLLCSSVGHGQDVAGRNAQEGLKPVERANVPAGLNHEGENLKAPKAGKPPPLVHDVVVIIKSSHFKLNKGEDVDRYLKCRNDGREVTKDIQEFGLYEAEAIKLRFAAELERRRIKKQLMAVPDLLAKQSNAPSKSLSILTANLSIALDSPLRSEGSFYHKVLQSIVGHDVPALPDPSGPARKHLRALTQ